MFDVDCLFRLLEFFAGPSGWNPGCPHGDGNFQRNGRSGDCVNFQKFTCTSGSSPALPAVHLPPRVQLDFPEFVRTCASSPGLQRVCDHFRESACTGVCLHPWAFPWISGTSLHFPRVREKNIWEFCSSG